jgi:hypothetical protein
MSALDVAVANLENDRNKQASNNGRLARGELAQLRANLATKEAELAKAWEVIDNYSQYHEGEWNEIPEQGAGIKWLENYENEHVETKDIRADLAAAKAELAEARRIIAKAQRENEMAHYEGGGAWNINGDFENEIDTFLASHPEPTKEPHPFDDGLDDSIIGSLP